MDYDLPEGAPSLDGLEAYARQALWRLLDDTYPDERAATVLGVADRVLAMRHQASAAGNGLQEDVEALRAAVAHHEGALVALDKAIDQPLKSTETVAGLRAALVQMQAWSH